MLEDKEPTEKIIACAFRVHQQLGAGFAEKVYENAMMIELRKLGFDVKQQSPITVYYEGKHVGEYFADILVENKVVCELKTVQQLISEHEVQSVNYLAATGHNTGLLLNFGKSVSVKRKFREYRRPDQLMTPDVNPVIDPTRTILNGLEHDKNFSAFVPKSACRINNKIINICRLLRRQSGLSESQRASFWAMTYQVDACRLNNPEKSC